MIAAFRALSARSLNVNVFCHQPAKLDARVESAWIERLRPAFARFGATPPTHLTEIYRSFVVVPKLGTFSGEEVCQILASHGFRRVRQKGSHATAL